MKGIPSVCVYMGVAWVRYFGQLVSEGMALMDNLERTRWYGYGDIRSAVHGEGRTSYVLRLSDD